MHVAIHALRGGDGAGEGVLEGMAALLVRNSVAAMAFALGLTKSLAAMRRRRAMVFATPALHLILDRWIDGDGLTITAIFGIDKAVARFAIIGVNHMATSAARLAIVPRLIIGAHEPHKGIIEPGLMDIECRNGDANAGRRATVRLFEIRPSWLLKLLDRTTGVG